MNRSARLLTLVCLLFVAVDLRFDAASAVQEKPLRIGIIGLDTSHVTAFTALLNDPARQGHVPGGRVVAAFKGGSPDVESSANRIDGFTAELRDKWGVKVVDSIEELCREVDVVMLMSVDGRRHLEQVRPVFAARKRVFIDKPFAGSFRDAAEIVRLARESDTPFFSSSSLRFVEEVQSLRNDQALEGILGAVAWSPSPTEPHHPDLFWYGIHGVEMLYTLMGRGCESVTRTYTDGTDIVTGRWKDGRVGTFRGIRDGQRTYGAVAFGRKAVRGTSEKMRADYRGLVVEIMKFFRSGAPPVAPEETLEMMAFMEAADLSRARGGAPAGLSEVLK
ncbi:MAG: Gfo/Idh/MocA family oxidoreductase [Blastocatellales bacterium]|nr:Gfo/Idh/MocA family oxidoreductase [Blastocatellales bacterium]